MTSEEYEKSSRLWYLAPIFLGIVGGLVAYLILKKDNPKLAKRCLIVGILVSIIPLIIGISFLLYGTMFAGHDYDNPSIIRQQIENNDVALFIMPNNEIKVVWGAVTTTNTGSTPVSIDLIAVRGIVIPFTNWYVDKDQSRVTSNFVELQANKIDDTGQMLDSFGLTNDCGGPSLDVLRINLDESKSIPTLCLEKVSGPVALESGQSVIIYFKTDANSITSLNVGQQTSMSIRAGKAFDIESVTTQSIPIKK